MDSAFLIRNRPGVWQLDAKTGVRKELNVADEDLLIGKRWTFAYASTRNNAPPQKGVLSYSEIEHYVSFEIPVGQSLYWTAQDDRCVVILSHGGNSPGQYAWIDGKEKRLIKTGISAPPDPVCFLTPTTVLSEHYKEGLFKIDLIHRSRTPFKVPLPRESNVVEVHLSPKGDRLLWYLDWGDRSLSWMDRIMQRLGWNRPAANTPQARQPPEHLREGLWISRLDGSQMHEIGEVPCEWAPAGFYMPRWLPDGQHISFLYRHGMYIVPAD